MGSASVRRDFEDARAWLDAGAVALGVGSDLVGDSMAAGDYDAARTSVREWLAIVAGPA
jgi:2-dehydro-3-deoxyphosphogluconate aldolase/(4S)-4-hydroxy-2-oxoglutarate aldolase